MGLEPNQTELEPWFLKKKRTEPEPLLYKLDKNPNQTLIAIEPEQNRTQTIRVLSHSTPHHTNGQRNATLVNTKTSQSFLFHLTKWASASHFWKQRRLESIVTVQNALWVCQVLCCMVSNYKKKITSYVITKLNLTFPRTRTKPNLFKNLTRTRTEPNPNNEGSFPCLLLSYLGHFYVFIDYLAVLPLDLDILQFVMVYWWFFCS